MSRSDLYAPVRSRIIDALATAPHGFLSTDELLIRAYAGAEEPDYALASIRALIHRLRQDGVRIETVRGYRLVGRR